MYGKSVFYCFMAFFVCNLMMGCGEMDPIMVDNSACNCELMEEYSMALISPSCEDLMAELEGTWEGLGVQEDTRLEFHTDGNYTLWAKRRNWFRKFEGRFWIDFDISEGMYRTVMHMETSDNDDYPVRYRIVDDVIYFEEPSDFEPSLRYARIHPEDLSD